MAEISEGIALLRTIRNSPIGGATKAEIPLDASHLAPFDDVKNVMCQCYLINSAHDCAN